MHLSNNHIRCLWNIDHLQSPLAPTVPIVGIFDNLKKLRFLSLSSNLINQLLPHTFGNNLLALRELYLGDNHQRCLWQINILSRNKSTFCDNLPELKIHW